MSAGCVPGAHAADFKETRYMALRITKRLLAAAAAVCMAVSGLALQATAESLSDMYSDNSEPVVFHATVEGDYAQKLKEYSDKGYAPADIAERITVNADRFRLDAAAAVEYSTMDGKRFFLWNSTVQSVSLDVTVPVSGLYTFGFVYAADTVASADIVRTMTVDGAMPYEECGTLCLPRKWKAGEITQDASGDEITPLMEQLADVQSEVLYDSEGRYALPLQIYLEQGSHSLSFGYNSMDAYIAAFFLDTYAAPLSYAQFSAKYAEQKDSSVQPVMFEAEGSMLYTNSSTLNLDSDGDPLCSPISRGSARMNVVGGSSNQKPGTAVTFSFDVPQSGVYKLALRIKQNYRDGLPSYRKIAVDGQVPFAEFAEYKFKNSSGWRTEVLSAEDGAPYLLYLESGTHTLTLTALQADYYALNKILKTDAQTLSDLLLKIRKITGNDPDYNYDYRLDTQIPDMLSTFQQLEDSMERMMSMISGISGQTTAKYNELKNMIDQLEKLKKDVFKIPRKLDDLNTIVTQYSSWITQFELSPLMLDYGGLYAADATVKSTRSNFFQNAYSTLVNFVYSFRKDYNSVTSYTGEDGAATINVWVARGNDWGKLTKRFIDSEFTPQTGIGVNMNIVPAGQLNAGATNTLMLSITSGSAPDVCLGVDSGSIGEFAMRDVLTPLNDLDGYEALAAQIYDTLFIKNTYKGSVYGIPETMNFMVLLYRKDIFSDLKLSVPTTWEDLCQKTLPVLLRNNMEVYLPLSAGSSLYPTLLYQRGGKLYNDELTESQLTSSVSYDAFSDLCNFVKVYGFATNASFFNRFRSGEMPAGIADMTTYMQFATAAPELAGRWGIAPIPGYRQGDGSINRTHLSAASTSVMMIDSGSGKTDASWKFIQWWMSESAQLKFGYAIEAQMGTAARWNSANTNAFFGMAWDIDDKEVIRESFAQIDDIPVVMGGYYTSRYINNAYNQAAISNKDMREALEKANKSINAELERRRSR